MADLEEPILYFLGKVVAITPDEVETYLGEDGMDKIHIEQEKEFIQQISSVQSKLAMIQNILLRQEEVWNRFSGEFSTKVWKDDFNKDTLAKFKDITLRPLENFARFRKRIQRIDEDAKRVEKLILVQLDLKAKHADLRESHNSQYVK
jgi:hypothetical protein